MRSLIVTEFVTLDGVVQAPGGEPTHPHSGWVFDFHGEEQAAYKLAELLACDTMLVGRVTYESFAAAWPDREGEFADRMNAMAKVLVSNTIRDPEWSNTTVLAGGTDEIVAGVGELKRAAGGPILVAGSKTLVDTLLDHDLVDELHLMVFPVTIGDGLRMFSGTVKKTPWTRTDTVTFASGVRVDTYRPA